MGTLLARAFRREFAGMGFRGEGLVIAFAAVLMLSRVLARKGLSKNEISGRLRISRTSVRRFPAGSQVQQNA
jgi:hypothetical protein